MSTLTEQITAINDQVRELRKELPRIEDEEIRDDIAKRIVLLREAQDSLNKFRNVIAAMQVEI